MELKIENTPNKDIIKFVAPHTLVEGSFEISNFDEAKNIPLAQELLKFSFITKILITANFIALQKNESIDWELVKNEIKEIIIDELLANPSIIIKPQKNPITVYAESTPNQEVMKFVTSRILVEGIIEIKDVHEAKDVPLALYLLSFPYVKEIFICDNFISITKNKDFDWQEIAMEIRTNISEYLKDNKDISYLNELIVKESIENSDRKAYTPIEEKIKKILDEYVLPAVSGDGGNIDLVSFDETTKTAKMILQGACSGCPSSVITLKNGIENLLKQMLPNEVENVEAING